MSLDQEVILRFRVTRGAARLVLGAVLLTLPSTWLTPASHDITLSSFLPAPTGHFSTMRVDGKAVIASNNGADVHMSTTACLTSLAGRWARQSAMAQAASLPNEACRANALNDDRDRAAVRILNNWDQGTPDNVIELPTAKLFVRGDIVVDRIIWNGTKNVSDARNASNTMILDYWPDEIGALSSTGCSPALLPDGGDCNTGQYGEDKPDIILKWTTKNSTGPSVGYYRTYLWGPGTTDLSNALTQIRSNVYQTTTMPQVTVPCNPSFPCPHGVAVQVNCKSDIVISPPPASSTRYFDVTGTCTFKLRQNVLADYPFRADVRLMCVKMTDDRFARECAAGIPANERHPDCVRRCPADPETLTCPLVNDAQSCS